MPKTHILIACVSRTEPSGKKGCTWVHKVCQNAIIRAAEYLVKLKRILKSLPCTIVMPLESTNRTAARGRHGLLIKTKWNCSFSSNLDIQESRIKIAIVSILSLLPARLYPLSSTSQLQRVKSLHFELVWLTLLLLIMSLSYEHDDAMLYLIILGLTASFCLKHESPAGSTSYALKDESLAPRCQT